MKSNQPRIMDYLDFRQYLRDYMAVEKKHNPAFSQRYFAQKAKIPPSNASILSAAIAGRKKLGPELRLSFARGLGLDERQTRYFDLLVQFNQAKKAAQKNFFLSQMAAFRDSRAKVLRQDQYTFFSHWLYPAVWNAFGMHPQATDPEVIRRMMLVPVEKKDMEHALQVLQSVGLITKAPGGYRVSGSHLATDPKSQNRAAKQSIEEYLTLSQRMMGELPQKERDYSSFVFSASRECVQEMERRIQSFKEELRDLIDNDSKEDRVCVMNMQLFPIAGKGITTKGSKKP